MDLRQLRYFITVAEELNFSRAAEKLHMSQPPLSHSIKTLEEELGIALLLRTRREVRLTDAGRVFLEESRAVLEQARLAVDAAVRTAAGNAGTIRLGMATSAVFNVMASVLERIRERFPAVDVAVTDMESQEQIRSIALSKLDVGFVHWAPDIKGMASVILFTEPFCAVLPDDHPLCVQDELTVQDLAKVRMVGFSRDHAPALSAALVATCLQAGFNPQVAHTGRHPMTILQMVRLGLGVALVPRSFVGTAVSGVQFRELPEAEGRVRISAIWKENNPSELVQRVVAETLKEMQPTPSSLKTRS